MLVLTDITMSVTTGLVSGAVAGRFMIWHLDRRRQHQLDRDRARRRHLPHRGTPPPGPLPFNVANEHVDPDDVPKAMATLVERKLRLAEGLVGQPLRPRRRVRRPW
jgi:hypothetical protein